MLLSPIPSSIRDRRYALLDAKKEESGSGNMLAALQLYVSQFTRLSVPPKWQ